MCSVEAHCCSLNGYLCNQLLNSMFNIEYNVQRYELGMLGWNFGRIENICCKSKCAAVKNSRSRISCKSFAEKQKLNPLRELCRKAEASQEQAQTVARYFEKLHFICLFILHCVALYRFLYCIDGALSCFILIDAALYRFLYCITRRYTIYCISAALYRILHWCGAIPLWCRLYPPLPLRFCGWRPLRPFCCL